MSFSATGVASPSELDEFEQEHRCLLPEGYRHFLCTVGAGQLFVDRHGLGIKFHAPDDLREFSRSVFANAAPDEFPDLLLVCSLTSRGDFGALDLRSAGKLFAVLSHEEDPATWRRSTASWIPFENWIIQLVESKGESDLP